MGNRVVWNPVERSKNYKSWDVTNVYNESHLEQAPTTHQIKKWLEQFLKEFTQIVRGTSSVGIKSPDQKFIEALESALSLPIRLNYEKLHELYQNVGFKTKLDKWMREDQGWIIHTDPDGIRENLERSSKFACFALVNKLVFHEALLKRYGKEMNKLSIPDYVDTGDELRLHLEGFFGEAKAATGDYETVFGEDHSSLGNRIPFYSDIAVSYWRELINQIHEFDFSKLDYEIIGSIFERLISPEERHKYGQFYTIVEIVDLINSFCIRKGDEKIMDPACGGGTFLVRAYARKRELQPSRKHGQLLSDLFGIDVSHFATHLTTINLATRDLIDDENYPQIARSDFFDIKAHDTFLSLPTSVKSSGLGETQHRKVEIPPLDAIVGNPPYVRQEDIPSTSKEHYKKLAKNESNADLTGRSDLHCYFWPHSHSFLKDDGYLCLLTSSQWLDVDYGFKLQEWVLRNFEIHAIFESAVEPWFIGARVSTTVTILRRQKDEKKRMKNNVRFVQLRQPIKDIFSHDGTTAGAVQAADSLRDEIMSLKKNTVNSRYRARLVNQGYLWDQGVSLGVIMGKSKEHDDLDVNKQNGHYYGGKWGIYLRAPDLWFDLLDEFGEKLVPLGSISKIHRGITSGKDSFFFPQDCSQEWLSKCEDNLKFEVNFYVKRKDVKSGKIKLVKCGDGRGEIRPIESKYLAPEIHSLMDVNSFSVDSSSCSNFVLLVHDDKRDLSGTYVLDYIKWGESLGYHKLPTCKGRSSESTAWYDLTNYLSPSIIVPKIQQYRLIAFVNPENLLINSSLLGLYNIPEELLSALCGTLNSTFSILSRILSSRILGNEGTIQLDVYLAKMMLVPNVNNCSGKHIERLTNAFENLKQRNALQFIPERRMREMAYSQSGKEAELENLSDICELDMADRRELDDAVLEMLGVNSKKRRNEMIDELYAYLRSYFEDVRSKEEMAIVNKKTSSRKGTIRPADISKQIYDEIFENEKWIFRVYSFHFIDMKKPFSTYDIPLSGNPEPTEDMFSKSGVRFMKGKKQIEFIETKLYAQSEFIKLVADAGVRGLVRIPLEEKECNKVYRTYKEFITLRDKRLKDLIAERTADDDLRNKVFASVMSMVLKTRLRPDI